MTVSVALFVMMMDVDFSYIRAHTPVETRQSISISGRLDVDKLRLRREVDKKYFI